MRELLTGLAILLIVVLTTVLVAPYLIDWNGQRAFIEARLGQVLGQKVTIGGTIDVKLLPTPYLVLGQTVIGDDESPVRLSIHHLDLELSVTPLLHGEVDVTQARLVEPTIRVALAPDRTLPALPDAPAFHADVTLEHIAVTGGTLAVADPMSGRTFVLDNLDFEADAASLAGPFKGAGTEGPEAAPTSFRFSTQAAQDGRARTRLVVAGNAAHAGIDLDGTLALTSAGRETVRQSFDGKVIVTGRLDESAGAPVAWTLSGPIQADPRKATLDGGELRLGGEDKGLTLAASGTADLGATPHLALELAAKTLDLDRLSGAPADNAKPTPPQLPPLATLRRALVAATPPLPTAVDVTVDTATWAGESLAGLSAHVDVGAPGPQPFALAGDGPGGARLDVRGTLAPQGFIGKIALTADDLPKTAAWLRAIDASFPLRRADLPAGAFSASADVTSGPGTLAASRLALGLGRSKLAGTARLDLASGARPAKLTAELTAKTLALDTLPDLSAWRGPGRALDLDLRLDAQTLQVAQAGGGALATGNLRFAVTKSGRHLALTSFSADNLGGATIAADGTLDPTAAHLALRVDTAHLDVAARLVRQVAPGDAADALVARAPALAPARLRLDATWRATEKGALAPTQGTIEGTLGASTLSAQVVPDGAPDAGDADAVTVRASLAAPEGTALLEQLGLPALPIDTLGASKVSLEAHGQADRLLDSKLSAAFGATTIDVAGRFRVLASPRGGSGSLAVKSSDLSPLLRSLALALPDMTARIPAEANGTLAYGTAGLGLTDLKAQVAGTTVTGTLRLASATSEAPALTGALDLDHLALSSLFGLALGAEQPAAPGSAWSSLAFGSALADPPRAALDLTAKTLDLAPGVAATDATLSLAVAPSLVTIRQFAAALDGGHLGGSVSLRRDGRQAGIEGKLEADGVAIDLPGVRGKLTGTLDLAGGGASAFGLVSSLAGTGEATIADLTLPQADPAALRKVFAEVEADDLTVDADTVARAAMDAAKAPLQAGTRRFDLALAGGTLAFTPKPADAASAAPVASVVDASLDLRQPSLTARATETLSALPKGWAGAPPALVIAWSGPPRAPRLGVDVSAFINAVAARALARESARIEAYEQDVRERAFFNARLESERRRAQDKAEAEAEAREAAEAARIAKARKEAAARAAAKAAQEEAAQEEAAAKAAQEQPPSARPRAESREHPAEPREAPRFAPARRDIPGDPSAAGRY